MRRFLLFFNIKIRDSNSISYENLRQRWLEEKFSESQLKELLTIGEFFSGEINLNKFTVLVCASVASVRINCNKRRILNCLLALYICSKIFSLRIYVKRCNYSSAWYPETNLERLKFRTIYSNPVTNSFRRWIQKFRRIQ